jgi:hypothetical protein
LPVINRKVVFNFFDSCDSWTRTIISSYHLVY